MRQLILIVLGNLWHYQPKHVFFTLLHYNLQLRVPLVGLSNRFLLLQKVAYFKYKSESNLHPAFSCFLSRNNPRATLYVHIGSFFLFFSVHDMPLIRNIGTFSLTCHPATSPAPLLPPPASDRYTVSLLTLFSPLTKILHAISSMILPRFFLLASERRTT